VPKPKSRDGLLLADISKSPYSENNFDLDDIDNLPAFERFCYWIVHRHEIYLKRKMGMLRPWTDDWVFQETFFTNPYRENDKTTIWFRENIRGPLREQKEVLFATVAFRWFNLVKTGELLMRAGDSDFGLFTEWDEKIALALLQKSKPPIFTGAYMIKAGNGPPGCKVINVCKAITGVWEMQDKLLAACQDNTLRGLWKELTQINYLGGFMSYEIVCDLRYTHLLENATDVDTWANPGPGALRGLLRLQGGAPKSRQVRISNPIKKMAELLEVVRKTLPFMPAFELREIEHSLCEFDKMERARLGDGKLKRKYNGKATNRGKR
jgi:hypothetical protein